MSELLFSLHNCYLNPVFLSSSSASNLWPLVAVSHQMTVREAVPFSLEQLGGFASRNQSN